MAALDMKPRWRAVGKSVRGASHHHSGLPNQDAITWAPDSGMGPPVILAIADGHGSPSYFRSDQGSALAVETAREVLKELLAGQPDPINLSAIKRIAEERVPQEITRRWQKKILMHLEMHPWKAAEWEVLIQKKGTQARRAIESRPALAYGATLLAVLLTETFILYLQLGDGDILTVSVDGTVTAPIPRDARLIANETTSLCVPNAWRDFQLHFQVLAGVQPALITLSTDGYANSFAKPEGFRQSASDYLNLIREEGVDAVVGYMEDWLNEVSSSGSGDDVTLGLLCRMDACSKAQRMQNHSESKTAQLAARRSISYEHRSFKGKDRIFQLRRLRQARKLRHTGRV
ncbi:MAG: protein phosphatase 2C domain-containing protein [Anaerolineae bacterium]|nr:protein phosphatase 2C domain-containing protein [Anaerolineae bacterium]